MISWVTTYCVDNLVQKTYGVKYAHNDIANSELTMERWLTIEFKKR